MKKKVPAGPRVLGTKEEMWGRYNASVTNQCVACGQRAKRVYAILSHTNAVLCTKGCRDHFLDFCGV